MGERVGGNDPCDPPAKRSFVRRTWDTIAGWFKGKPHGKVTLGMPTSSREPDLPTFSQAPDKRMPSTPGAAIQDYRDSGPTLGYGTAMGMNIIAKMAIDQILDFGNYVRNSAFNKSDYSGLGPRMTKWDGNTMSATESDNLKFSALLTADGWIGSGLASTETAVAGSINYTKSADQFGLFASKATPQSGALDVIGHGSTVSIEVNNLTISGGKIAVNHRSLANLIKRNPQFTGQDVRLLSCSTGKCNFAQDLANKLNVNVFAPNEVIWALPNGKYFVAPMNAQRLPVYSQPGKMIKFTPKK